MSHDARGAMATTLNTAIIRAQILTMRAKALACDANLGGQRAVATLMRRFFAPAGMGYCVQPTGPAPTARSSNQRSRAATLPVAVAVRPRPISPMVALGRRFCVADSAVTSAPLTNA